MQEDTYSKQVTRLAREQSAYLTPFGKFPSAAEAGANRRCKGKVAYQECTCLVVLHRRSVS